MKTIETAATEGLDLAIRALSTKFLVGDLVTDRGYKVLPLSFPLAVTSKVNSSTLEDAFSECLTKVGFSILTVKGNLVAKGFHCYLDYNPVAGCALYYVD
jgi:hypothetical protein